MSGVKVKEVDRLWTTLEKVNNLSRNGVAHDLPNAPRISDADKAAAYKKALDLITDVTAEAIDWMEKRREKRSI